ncbi:hypothetical protein L195_g035867 [Trifolium pratense]|uniref:Reverse transcriptase Ty1/copia-type domain-containing protein n=1 Tax=Trifolium pratense TaxID=57577 RepID=A0A2K3LMX7_TRIPR|nr:hypothetical protein L195_g035867 [Trifolium pratense]
MERMSFPTFKQAPRAWFSKFHKTITQLNFSSSAHDSALFTRKTDNGTIVLLLYVDDMIIIGDDSIGIEELKKFLCQHFEMKDLGPLTYFMGLEVLSSSGVLFLSHAKYDSDLVSRACLTDCKILLLNPTFDLLLKMVLYLPMPLFIGSSQFMASPRSTHYAAVLRIIRYIKGALYYGLHYSATSSLILNTYSDVDWAGDPTRSSTESEYRALADTTSEILWLRWLLADLETSQSSPTNLYCDNRSAIQIAHNDVFHERTKHIEIDCHFIR